MPRRSRAPNSLRSCLSQMTKANMPFSFLTASGPSSMNRRRMTSVSELEKKRQPLPANCWRSST